MAKSARIFLFIVVVATSYRHYRHGSITLASKFLGNAMITISTLFHNAAMTTVCIPTWTNKLQLRTIPGHNMEFFSVRPEVKLVGGGRGGEELLPAMRKPTACISMQGL